ncbi:MAG: MEDS domain-containing protein [Nitrososphaerales archaeon]
MVRSIIVADIAEVQKLAESLPNIANQLGDGRCVPVLTTSIQQLLLVQNGNPVMGYRVADASISQEAGFRAIENFLDRCGNKKHLVMLYDEAKLARLIEFRYVKIGLEKREQCMYVIPEDDIESPESIKKQMEEFGIDTEHYVRDGSLKFVRIQDPAKDPDGFKAGCQKTLESLVSEVRKPVRMVLHVRYQFNTKNEIEEHADFENVIESSFTSFPGSILCNHYIGSNTQEKHGEWTKKMLQTHDNVFVVSSQRGIPFIFT